ncbi:MAG: squalene--hopene cyclase [Pseudomonadota bacterium]|nr:squalene--hopene cyclase [Pseudomonadota bacterium]
MISPLGGNNAPPEGSPLARAVAWLLRAQLPGGYWNAPVETNCCMEAQWVLAMTFCGLYHPKTKGVVDYIVNAQRPDGSWEVYRHAEQGDINTTVECYAALRYAGFPPEEKMLRNARRWLLANDWTDKIRVFTKYWLALFGEWPWEHTPDLPPEIVYLPKWFPFNIYHFASWARATIMPLAIVSAEKPVKPLPPHLRLDELFPAGRDAVDYRLGRNIAAPLFSWSKFFLATDKLLHAYSRLAKGAPLRRSAKKAVLAWILSHQDEDGYWGGIQPPWIYGIVALHVLGFSPRQTNMARALNAPNLHWSEETPGGTRIKATESPVWDTMLAAGALLAAGQTPGNGELDRAIDYLLDKENRHYGDWSQLAGRMTTPSGWAFERANRFYPDIDDTAVCIVVLRRYRSLLGPEDERCGKIDAAVERAQNWLLAMRSRNGGWGAFDKDNTRAIIAKLPFCDFGEVLDPPSADVTAHVVEALAACGYDRDHPVMRQAIRFLYDEQEEDGAWFGRWGVNYIYGVWCVTTALLAAGETAENPRLGRALAWLADRQNDDGGWGESAASYMQPGLSGRSGASTASQTAWAILALAGADGRYEKEIRAGVTFLERTQTGDGTWIEEEFTGAGFPGYGLGAKIDLRKGRPLPQGKELSRGFMLRYGYYCHYFPIMALSRAGKLCKG